MAVIVQTYNLHYPEKAENCKLFVIHKSDSSSYKYGSIDTKGGQ